jgi:pyridoxine 5-phosphate synthase
MLTAMVKLSVNVNKVALLRNARGGNRPDLIQVARDCVRLGADGITVHPRPDQRHIRPADAIALKQVLEVELNIEGYPSEPYLQLIEQVRPAQATLVPDPPQALTSNAGWDTLAQRALLEPVMAQLRGWGVRSSLFIACDRARIEAARAVGADRVELYTGPYAEDYANEREFAVAPYRQAAEWAHAAGLGVNAGHDLDRDNLAWFCREVPHLQEVSIGHALWSDALYLGLERTLAEYRRALS